MNETLKKQQDLPLQSKASAHFAVKKLNQNMFFFPAVLVVFLWNYVLMDVFDIAMYLTTLSASHTISA